MINDENEPDKNNFSNGAFVISRSIFDSDIWQKPSEYLKTWIYLVGRVNHSGRKYRGYYCERGQYFCDYRELRDQLEFKIGYRNKKYNETHMKNVLKFLRSTHRITTMKKPRGILITILNYDAYQTLSNYEKTSEKTNEETNCKPTVNRKPPSINKNEKELMNYKNSNKQKHVSFCEFFEIYPCRSGRKRSRDEAEKYFMDDIKDDDIPDVLTAAKNFRDSEDVIEGIGIRDAIRFLRNDYWREWLVLEEEKESIATSTRSLTEILDEANRRYKTGPYAETK